MTTSVINNVQPCGLEYKKNCYLFIYSFMSFINDMSDTLSTKAKTLTICGGKFDATLLEIILKNLYWGVAE